MQGVELTTTHFSRLFPFSYWLFLLALGLGAGCTHKKNGSANYDTLSQRINVEMNLGPRHRAHLGHPRV